MIFALGEILYDVFPGFKNPGGAPFNFAMHLKKLGFDVRFFSRIGTDMDGDRLLKFLKKNRFNIKDIQRDSRHATGRVNIRVNENGEPQFEIQKNMAYDYIESKNIIEIIDKEDVDLIYFGTLAQRTKAGFREIQKLLSHKKENVKYFFDINLRPQCYSKKIIVESLKHADILKCNTEELDEIKEIHDVDYDAKDFYKFLEDKYKLEMIVVTHGDAGSCICTRENLYSINIDPLEFIVDTVGAGDAYSAILAAGFLNAWAREEILSTATDFASEICKIKGAVPESFNIYENFKQLIDG